MKSGYQLGVSVAAAVALATAAGAARFPTSPLAPSLRTPDHLMGKTPKAMHVLFDTIIHDGDLEGTTQPGGFYTLDSYDMKCANSKGCTVEVDVQSEYGGNSTAGNLYSTCVLVDGSYLNPACPYQGTIPADGTFQTGYLSAWGTVTKGQHSIVVQGYSSAPAISAFWKTSYKIYLP